jgi:hypothetical protein
MGAAGQALVRQAFPDLDFGDTALEEVGTVVATARARALGRIILTRLGLVLPLQQPEGVGADSLVFAAGVHAHLFQGSFPLSDLARRLALAIGLTFP